MSSRNHRDTTMSIQKAGAILILAATLSTGAPRRRRMALVLPEGHEKVIIDNPVLFRKLFSQCPLGLLRGLCLDISEPVGNPVNMGINAYPRFVIPESHHKIRCFSSHPLELQKFIDLIRDF